MGSSRLDSSKERFKISSGLKDIIGHDLINDKFIAVFELVKNAYDANASEVHITFGSQNEKITTISIADNGWGMTRDDLRNKWLFVAYSEKRQRNANFDSYRERIKRQSAGAKGIGRFSCDRLGSYLTIDSKTVNDDVSHRLAIDWSQFEKDDAREFGSINVDLSIGKPLPNGWQKGTILTISRLRDDWDRVELLRLKRSLMKLINPDQEDRADKFDIYFHASIEKAEDARVDKKTSTSHRDIVNGKIQNDVFIDITKKATYLSVEISNDGKVISTKLVDCDQFVFSFSMKNRQFPLLHGIKCELYYMNRSAKVLFAKRVGVSTSQYGSIFVYKNGFRINGYGEPGQDFFAIDRRKAQGTRRFLGTRDLLGRIVIRGENPDFVETSSRANGFIETAAVASLQKFFLDCALKVLERYVVKVIVWGQSFHGAQSNTDGNQDELQARLLKEIAGILKRDDVTDFDVTPNLWTSGTKTQDDSFNSTVSAIESLAKQSDDERFVQLAKRLTARANQVIKDNSDLEQQNTVVNEELNSVKHQYNAKNKQVYFLEELTKKKPENMLNALHSIFTDSEVIRGYTHLLISELTKSRSSESDHIQDYLSNIALANNKIRKTAELTINGNDDLSFQEERNLLEYLREYINSNAAPIGINYDFSPQAGKFECRFNPIYIGIILDNVTSNSKKNGASLIQLHFKQTHSLVKVQLLDNGNGLSNGTSEKDLFGLGFSSNAIQKGFGIGLQQVWQLAKEMHGEVRYLSNYREGFGLELELKK